jgi:3-ketosteroid 9alpha-monooxygenase subunit B
MSEAAREPDHASVRRDHGYHALTVKAIVEETFDTRTFVFDVPDALRDQFSYRPGQFCTVRVAIDGEDVLRCYSMSSAPGVDADLAVTVKRVPGGVMSNWLLDHVSVGHTLELTRPSGVFSPRNMEGTILGFGGGSGVTPIISIVKHVLATTDRPVKLLVANRDRASVIFGGELDRLRAAYEGRFELLHHLDADGGYLDAASIATFAEDAGDPEVFVCGPTPFMDLIERGLVDAGVDPSRIAIERFVAGGPASTATSDIAAAQDVTETLTLVLKGTTTIVDYVAGDTVLDAARRAGLKPPFSCELGNCASCMAFVSEGGATMRANNALTAAEVDEGWVLTCQARPHGRTVTVEHENL